MSSDVYEADQVCKVWVKLDSTCRVVASALDCFISVCVSRVIYGCVTIADGVKGQQVCPVRVTIIIHLGLGYNLGNFYQGKGKAR